MEHVCWSSSSIAMVWSVNKGMHGPLKIDIRTVPIHYNQLGGILCSKVQCCFSPSFSWAPAQHCWKPCGDQTENRSIKAVMRRQQTGLRGSFRKREHGALHAHFGQRSRPGTFELSISNTEIKAWPKMQVAVGLWVGMYGYFSFSTNRKARELC